MNGCGILQINAITKLAIIDTPLFLIASRKDGWRVLTVVTALDMGLFRAAYWGYYRWDMNMRIACKK